MASKSAEDFVKEFAEQAAEDATEQFYDAYKRLQERTESPIEEVMLVALVYIFESWSQHASVGFLARDFRWGDEPSSPLSETDVYLQAKVGDYRADFLFDCHHEHAPRQTLVIECDGHDYHERTKSQAARDRSRDRWMTSRGISVMRFTGSEIWADPYKCAEEVHIHYLKLMGWW